MRKISLFFVFLLCSFVQAWQQKPMLGQQINRGDSLSYGLVGCWPFNEGCGNMIFDLSGNNYNGVFDGGTGHIPTWIPGKFGPAISFNDYYEEHIDFSSSGLPARNDNTGTLLAWVCLDDITNGYAIIAFSKLGSGYYYFYIYTDTSGYLHIKQRNDDTTDDVRTNNSLSAGQWYQIAITSDGSAYHFYINGVEQGKTVVSGSDSGDWLADTSNRNAAEFGLWTEIEFDGSLDHVMMWDRALTTSEIQHLYAKPFCMFLPPWSPIFFPIVTPSGQVIIINFTF